MVARKYYGRLLRSRYHLWGCLLRVQGPGLVLQVVEKPHFHLGLHQAETLPLQHLLLHSALGRQCLVACPALQPHLDQLALVLVVLRQALV